MLQKSLEYNSEGSEVEERRQRTRGRLQLNVTPPSAGSEEKLQLRLSTQLPAQLQLQKP